MALLRRGRSSSPGRIAVWCFLTVSLVFFALPIYVMIVTSLKSLPDIRASSIFAFPTAITFEPWKSAWNGSCIGASCTGLRSGFWNSIKILVPSVICSVCLGSITGYGLAFWKPRGAELLFSLLMFGAFIPYQMFIYPLAFSLAQAGQGSSLFSVVLIHVIFGLPITTMLFRNYYTGLPLELLKAAKVDGASFWRIFFAIILPMSTPIVVVAVILQSTGIWNDYLFGLVFAGPENQPMTVKLTSLVSTQFGDRPYNTYMAAALLTGAVPLIIYLVSGRYFVRGIAAGAVKG